MEAHLPEDKLAEIQTLLPKISASPHTTQCKLDYFLTKLSFVSSIIVPGCTFTHWLWDTNKRLASNLPSIVSGSLFLLDKIDSRLATVKKTCREVKKNRKCAGHNSCDLCRVVVWNDSYRVGNFSKRMPHFSLRF